MEITYEERERCGWVYSDKNRLVNSRGVPQGFPFSPLTFITKFIRAKNPNRATRSKLISEYSIRVNKINVSL